MIDRPSENASFGAASGAELPRPVADELQLDAPAGRDPGPVSRPHPSDLQNGDLPADAARGPIAFDALREPDRESSAPPDDVQLVPGARIANGRYRLLIFHGVYHPAVLAGA